MAEAIAGLGVAASIVAVIQITEEVLKLCGYAHDVKSAESDIAKIRAECESVLSVLKRLHEMCGTTNNRRTLYSLELLTKKDGTLSQYQADMEKLATELRPSDDWMNSKLTALKWPLKAKNVAKMLQSMERRKALLILAITMDHTALSTVLAADLRDAAGNIDIISGNMIAVSEKMTSVASAAGQILHDDLYRSVIGWLSPPDPSSNHNDAYGKRYADTGRWFLEGEHLKKWRNQASSFLWLHGIPGAGKSVLCSSIIEQISTSRSPSLAVAYFYFDFNDIEKQNPVNAIRSLIIQLLTPLPHVPEYIEVTYEIHRDGRQPSTAKLLEMLRALVELYDHTYIFLDALDECADQKELLRIITDLVNWNLGNLHVLATTREERDVGDNLNFNVIEHISLQGHFVDSDICCYVRERVRDDSRLKKWPGSVQDEIVQVLGKGAKGMFRWAACQLDTLSSCHNLYRLREALQSLPKDLDETYHRVLSQIRSGDEEDAKRVLQWLAFSARPVRLEEVAEALGIEYSDGPRFCRDRRCHDPLDILKICSSLVTTSEMDQQSQLFPSTQPGESTTAREVRLAHYTVKEYLLSQRIRNSSVSYYSLSSRSANCLIAETCLAYLLHFPGDSLNENSFEALPLAKYAAQHWPFHAHYGDDDILPDLECLLLRLFEPHSNQFLNWIRIHDEDFPLSDSNVTRDADSIPGPLYYSSLLGIPTVVKHLTNRRTDVNRTILQESPESGVDVNAPGGKYGNALQAASYRNHEGIVQLLLQRGANVSMQGGWYGNALQAASGSGSQVIVRLLLMSGANVNALGGEYGSALQAASHQGHEEIVQLLLERGAAVNMPAGRYGNALQAASYDGRENVVRLLLNAGANVNARGGEYGTALQAASRKCRKDVFRLLLECGANVDTPGGKYATAEHAGYRSTPFPTVRLLSRWVDKKYGEKSKDYLTFGVEVGRSLEGRADVQSGEHRTALHKESLQQLYGSDNVVRPLLDHEAAANRQGGKYGNALQAASYEGQEESVRLLLDNGATVDALGGELGSALQAASHRGHEEIVQLLLERGAAVNMPAGRYGNALQAASYDARESVVRLLLNAGANVNAQGGEYGTALQAASHKGREDVVRLLLGSGANVNAQSGKYGNALHAASYAGKKNVVRLLLRGGADVNAHGRYGKALHAASVVGEEATVRLLLESGANVNEHGGEYGTALLAASFWRHEQIVRLLLENGACANALDSSFGNALGVVSEHGNEAIAGLLLWYGADVNAQGGKYGHALLAASVQGHKKVARLLLDAGANVNAKDARYGNALQGASYAGRVDVVRLLLERGADVNAQGGSWGNALQGACLTGQEEIVRLLLIHGADVNTQGGKYENALRAASERGHLAIVLQLLERGADVNIRNERYGNALLAASSCGHASVVLLLLEHGAYPNALVQGLARHLS